MPVYTLNINGKQQKVDVAADTPLLWVLRDNLRLLGTKYGCGIAMCGACTVHMNGTATYKKFFTKIGVRNLSIFHHVLNDLVVKFVKI